MTTTHRLVMMIVLATTLSCAALAADPINQLPSDSAASRRADSDILTITGHASVIDGRSLWFPQQARSIRLAGIDACELPQWSYDPKRPGQSDIPKPVPCGPLAKAWLKRALGNAPVTCRASTEARDGILIGTCMSRGRDLAVDMLRAGWARIASDVSVPARYRAWQRRAKNARFGMWSSYVLDMDEWRRKAVDRTLSRRPIADFNLLVEREHEISPPFEDARNRSGRVDR